MGSVRSVSELVPASLPGSWEAVRIATRVEAMGLLGPGVRRERMADLVGDALDALVGAGIARRDVETLHAADAAGVLAALARIAEALEASPNPETEWLAVTGRLGEELVARLCLISPSSLARYSGGVRATPDAVAHRLHHLALIVADLAGSYNDRGLRRWFDRPRPQLSGVTPASLLTGDWNPDDPGPRQVAELAAVLAGPGPAN